MVLAKESHRVIPPKSTMDMKADPKKINAFLSASACLSGLSSGLGFKMMLR
jgi:hypothetical protein